MLAGVGWLSLYVNNTEQGAQKENVSGHDGAVPMIGWLRRKMAIPRARRSLGAVVVAPDEWMEFMLLGSSFENVSCQHG